MAVKRVTTKTVCVDQWQCEVCHKDHDTEGKAKQCEWEHGRGRLILCVPLVGKPWVKQPKNWGQPRGYALAMDTCQEFTLDKEGHASGDEETRRFKRVGPTTWQGQPAIEFHEVPTATEYWVEYRRSDGVSYSKPGSKLGGDWSKAPSHIWVDQHNLVSKEPISDHETKYLYRESTTTYRDTVQIITHIYVEEPQSNPKGLTCKCLRVTESHAILYREGKRVGTLDSTEDPNFCVGAINALRDSGLTVEEFKQLTVALVEWIEAYRVYGGSAVNLAGAARLKLRDAARKVQVVK